MQYRITGKSEVRLSDLTLEVTFDIMDGDDVVLASQVVRDRPANVPARLDQLVAEYEIACAEAAALEVG